MNSSVDNDSSSSNALGDLRSFRFSKKPTFVHYSAASGSSTRNVEESPSKYYLVYYNNFKNLFGFFPD